MPAYKPGIRDKLIGIFILIKVIPLIILAWFAWSEISSLTVILERHVNEMGQTSQKTTEQVAGLAISSSIRALDIKSREAIERLTTDTANAVAGFLNARDDDITLVSLLTPDDKIYRQFLKTQIRPITIHDPWVLNEAGDAWVPETDKNPRMDRISAQNKENELDFHYRFPDTRISKRKIPLYLEMTFVDLSGNEKIKVTSSDILSSELKDISKKENTYCRAESYFEELKRLKPGEIYVSGVIGAYVKTHMIGTYTPKNAEKQGIEFSPETSGYAGKENPVGQKFQGLVRWAAPVVMDGHIQGWVTLALDHTHIMEFTDYIIPTEERYTSISDAGSGNYAFMWDDKGRNISHPRDYFITGFDPKTGEPAIPWLEADSYEKYKQSGLDVAAFLESMPEYHNQSLTVKSSTELIKQGFVALDCRYLNFAPQCEGWKNITQEGGSGSFVIEWSGLKKLTTAAAIPYYTGRYKESKRGFGIVTIGANVPEFHSAADLTAKEIKEMEQQYITAIETQSQKNRAALMKSMKDTASRLTLYTTIMIVIVIFIAIIMASVLTRRITRVVKGVTRFREGDLGHRLEIDSTDEMGLLGETINSMADTMQQHISELSLSHQKIEISNKSLKNQIKRRIQVQKQLQKHKDRLEGIVRERTIELEKEIVERKENEMAVKDLKNVLSRIIDSMPSIIIVVDIQARITLWNQEARSITGIDIETVKDRSVFEVLPFMKQEASIVTKAINQVEIQRDQKLEVMMKQERNFFDVTVYPLMSDKIEGAVIRIDNVTQSVAMEEMIIQTEKMQSIGSLAAGMAHEINNPLAGIMQNTQVLRNRIQENLPKNIEVARETGIDFDKIQIYMEKRGIFNMIESIMASGRRAADIVANMLTFSRKSESSFSEQNICELLDRTIEIIENDYDFKKRADFKNIEIVRDYKNCSQLVKCDSGKIQQVFFNILKNGAHAMIETAAERKPVFKTRIYQENQFMVITIEDNGPGMDEHIKTHIFEPFFTTKPVGVGTGLGLYVSYFIVSENHKGTITVESTQGKGTKFIVRLPIS